MAVCSISFLTRAGMCAPGRGTSTRLSRYVCANVVHRPHACAGMCAQGRTAYTRLSRYVCANVVHRLHASAGMCAQGTFDGDVAVLRRCGVTLQGIATRLNRTAYMYAPMPRWKNTSKNNSLQRYTGILPRYANLCIFALICICLLYRF